MTQPEERLISSLQTVIRGSVRVLAVLMVFVIVMGVVDVGWTLYGKLITAPKYILTISDMLATFGAFMAVLIAIEIFVNITIYLRDDVIHVKIVLATALMAISRKIIIMDFNTLEPIYVFGIAAVTVAIALAYYLVHSLSKKQLEEEH